MQGSTIATKNVAFCSKDVNSTTGWDCLSDGGEDWIRTRGCVSPEDRTLLAHKVRISSICGKRRVHTEESGRLHGADRIGANQRLVFFLRYASPDAIYFGLSFTLRADFFLAARCFLTTLSAASQSSALYLRSFCLRLGSLEDSHCDLQVSAVNPEAALSDQRKPR